MQFVDIVIVIVVLHLLLFSLFLFSHKKGKRASHRILGLFFLALAVNMAHAFLFRFPEYVVSHFPHVFYLGAPFAFLYAPLFYFYVKSLTNPELLFSRKDLLHAVPFVFYAVYLAIVFYFKPAGLKQEAILHDSVLSRGMMITLTAILQAQVLFYAIVVVRIVRAYRNQIKDLYSSIEAINYSWLKLIFIGLIVLWCADMLRFVSVIFSPMLWSFSNLVLYSGFLALCYIVMYKALRQPEIFSTMDERQPQKKQSLSKPVNDIYVEKLKRYIEKEKPYLLPEITLNNLSEKVSIPPRSLSEVIHTAYNQNFYDFINSYRIKESQRLLADQETTLKTVSQILFEVGFNSKSSFNQAFKKYAGMTPSEFKKNNTLIPQN